MIWRRIERVSRRESFSKLIGRLIHDAGSSASGESILDHLDAAPSLSDEEAQAFLQVVKENRAQARWRSHDLR